MCVSMLLSWFIPPSPLSAPLCPGGCPLCLHIYFCPGTNSFVPFFQTPHTCINIWFILSLQPQDALCSARVSAGKPLPLQFHVCAAVTCPGSFTGAGWSQIETGIVIPPAHCFLLRSSLLLCPKRGRAESIHHIEGIYWGHREVPAITMLSPHVSLILGMLNLSACKCLSATRVVFVPCNFNNCVIL